MFPRDVTRPKVPVFVPRAGLARLRARFRLSFTRTREKRRIKTRTARNVDRRARDGALRLIVRRASRVFGGARCRVYRTSRLSHFRNVANVLGMFFLTACTLLVLLQTVRLKRTDPFLRACVSRSDIPVVCGKRSGIVRAARVAPIPSFARAGGGYGKSRSRGRAACSIAKRREYVFAFAS